MPLIAILFAVCFKLFHRLETMCFATVNTLLHRLGTMCFPIANTLLQGIEQSVTPHSTLCYTIANILFSYMILKSLTGEAFTSVQDKSILHTSYTLILHTLFRLISDRYISECKCASKNHILNAGRGKQSEINFLYSFSSFSTPFLPLPPAHPPVSR